MPPRKKKAQTIEKEIKQEIVKKPEIAKRIIPEIPNTIYFYSYNQNLIKMESLDCTFTIDFVLIKLFLSEIKKCNLTGVQKFSVIRDKDTNSVSILPPVSLTNEELDEDMKTIVSELNNFQMSVNLE